MFINHPNIGLVNIGPVNILINILINILVNIGPVNILLNIGPVNTIVSEHRARGLWPYYSLNIALSSVEKSCLSKLTTLFVSQNYHYFSSY